MVARITQKFHDNFNFEAMWPRNANSGFNRFQNNDTLLICGYTITSMNIASRLVSDCHQPKFFFFTWNIRWGEFSLVCTSDTDIMMIQKFLSKLIVTRRWNRSLSWKKSFIIILEIGLSNENTCILLLY